MATRHLISTLDENEDYSINNQFVRLSMLRMIKKVCINFGNCLYYIFYYLRFAVFTKFIIYIVGKLLQHFGNN